MSISLFTLKMINPRNGAGKQLDPSSDTLQILPFRFHDDVLRPVARLKVNRLKVAREV